MSNKPSVLFASSEVYPFVKTGGLADVSYGLPRALIDNCDVHVVLPLYRSIDREKFAIVSLNQGYIINMGGTEYFTDIYGCYYEGIEYRFIYTKILCERDSLYGDNESAYVDNAERFGIFSYAIVEMLLAGNYNIVHLNDWQTALVALLLKEKEILNIKSIFTIHNLAYQGIFDKSSLENLGIEESCFTMQKIEFYNQVSFMKAGIAYGDKITTVSNNYAKEILTKEFGCGLDGFLNYHKEKLVGIVNGIDEQHYKRERSKKKAKKTYLKSVGFKGVKKPLFIFIGRFTWQKGLDLLIESLDDIALLDCNIAIVGEGEEKYHKALKEISDRHRNINLYFGYDESLSLHMYEATDFLLMPSIFEPCGLNQLIAMNCGAIPIVHDTGGLHDTVCDYKDINNLKKRGIGIVFREQNSMNLYKSIKEAIMIYNNKIDYKKIAKLNRDCDFSWSRSAKRYIELYKTFIDTKH
ncbi:MAG: glycogen/starch synthase [Campylobacterota bacterium]|nr:glycogen/starch synthase [Campylobacterota bacterium]